MTQDQHERNAQEFARMMGGPPQEAEQEQEPQRAPAAPRAPESIIIRPTHTRKSTAETFADMLSRSLRRF